MPQNFIRQPAGTVDAKSACVYNQKDIAHVWPAWQARQEKDYYSKARCKGQLSETLDFEAKVSILKLMNDDILPKEWLQIKKLSAIKRWTQNLDLSLIEILKHILALEGPLLKDGDAVCHSRILKLFIFLLNKWLKNFMLLYLFQYQKQMFACSDMFKKSLKWSWDILLFYFFYQLAPALYWSFMMFTLSDIQKTVRVFYDCTDPSKIS